MKKKLFFFLISSVLLFLHKNTLITGGSRVFKNPMPLPTLLYVGGGNK